MKDPDTEAIAVELFYWDYLNYILTEGEVREVLDRCTTDTDRAT